MMRRANTKIGDVFSVELDEKYKKHFQLVAFDLTQLNSDVIRAFKEVYPVNSNPEPLEIVKGEVDFYAHCVTKLGLKMKVWDKIGNTFEIGETCNVLFRDTYDYGVKVGNKAVRVSNKWYVWRINDKNFTRVGKLENAHRRAYTGIVINPLGIVELLKGNKYPINYPDFE